MDILKKHDIKDIRTQEKLQKFFRNEEEKYRFISSVIYRIRETEAFYGTVDSYEIISSSRDEENICTFDIQMTLRKKYPIENIRISQSISFVKENGTHHIIPPKYIGEIKGRKETPYPYFPYPH